MTAADPFALFDRWLADARNAGAVLPQAMALATADADGMPDARMVMVRNSGRDGFVFFTDRESAKGEQLRANPRAVLLGYWRELGRQVRVSGSVAETSPAEDDAAFRERPRDAQIAIAAWRQGTRIDHPAALQTVALAIEERVRNSRRAATVAVGRVPSGPGTVRVLGGAPGPHASAPGVPPRGRRLVEPRLARPLSERPLTERPDRPDSPRTSRRSTHRRSH